MAGRGRKSAVELSAPVGIFGPSPRPAPPRSLGAEAANEWREIVARMPVEWFPRETHALLVQLCRHIVRSQKLGESLDLETVGSPREIELSRQQREESRAITTLQRAMRLTQQARYDQTKRPGLATQKRPWEKTA